MRPRFNNQPQFQFQAAPTLKITECYYGRYDRIDVILVEHPELIDLIHRDIAEPLECEKAPDGTGEDCYKCSSETVLRIVICQIIEPPQQNSWVRESMLLGKKRGSWILGGRFVSAAGGSKLTSSLMALFSPPSERPLSLRLGTLSAVAPPHQRNERATQTDWDAGGLRTGFP